MTLPMRRRAPSNARQQPQVPQERHVALHRSHTNAVPESHIEQRIQPNQNNSDLPYDTVLDFGDGDALNLNDNTYEDPSPSSRTIDNHEDDEDFPVAHREDDFDDDSDPIDSRIAVDMPSSDYITDPDIDDESDNEEDEEPSDESDEDTEEEPLPEPEPTKDEESNEPKNKPQKYWLQGIKDKIKNEIGVPDENEEPDQQEPKTIPQLPSAEKPQRHTNGKGLSNILLAPVHMVMSTIRGLSKILRIILSLSGLVFLIVVAWLIFNIIPAVSNTSAQYTHDEGNVSVSSLSYANNKVSFSVDNESDMIAHISATASVKAWKPSISRISSIISPIDVMSCQSQSADLMPEESKTITLSCSGEQGIWMRPIVKVNNQ